MIPGVSIASSGPVRSVKLFCRVPVESIKRLALDAGSRTSQALCRVWLHDALGIVPERIEEHPIGVPVEESLADAVLLIGDRAMRTPEAGFHTVVDLASAWRELTGLPFVFALWVARPGVDLADLPMILQDCRDQGLSRAFELAEIHAPRLGLSVQSCFEYLTKALSFNLGAPELAGFKEFSQRASNLGLSPGAFDLVTGNRNHFAKSR